MIQRHVGRSIHMAAVPLRRAADIEHDLDGFFLNTLVQLFHRDLLDCCERQPGFVPCQNTVFQVARNAFKAHPRKPGSRLTNAIMVFGNDNEGDFRLDEAPSPCSELATQSDVQ